VQTIKTVKIMEVSVAYDELSTAYNELLVVSVLEFTLVSVVEVEHCDLLNCGS
jgi:hypothetical protein